MARSHESKSYEKILKEIALVSFERRPNVRPIKCQNKSMEHTGKYKYILMWLNELRDHSCAIDVRIEMAQNSFLKMNDTHNSNKNQNPL